MLQEMRSMWRNGGFRPFCIGAGVTILRDAVFGLIYTGIKAFGINYGRCDGPDGSGACYFGVKMVAGGVGVPFAPATQGPFFVC